MLSLLLLCYLLFEGASQVIRTQQTVAAEVGGSARFCCQLLQPKHVREVTWQKVSPGRQENLASSTKFYGHTVNRVFSHKVKFVDESLQNSSIVLRQVALEDEGCYRCLVNTYPEGAFMGQTCLQIHELHEPSLLVRPLNSSQEVLVSCRVTGRPPPNVTLAVLHPGLRLTNHSHVSVPNHNGTFTTTSTALLSGPRGHGGAQVVCVASVPSGPQLEASVTLHQDQHMSTEDFTWVMVLVAGGVVVVCCIIAPAVSVAFLWFKHKKKKNRDPEMNKTPLRGNQEHKGLDQTPGMHCDSESMRNRSPGGQPKRKESKASCQPKHLRFIKLDC